MKKRIFTIYIILNLALLCAFAQNDDLPESPVLRKVTVDTVTGNAWIYWSPSPSINVTSTIVFINQNDVWVEFDTVPRVDTIYKNLSSNAIYLPESYEISALYKIDTIDKQSPNTKEHTTIFLTLQFDSCRAELNLSWTPYVGWGDSLEYYSIFRSRNGGSFSIINSLSSESHTFTDTTIEAYTNYCYFIQAANKNSLTSTSNKVCKYTQMPKIPGFINADYATISSDNKTVSLSFTIDPESEIYHYKLLRTNDPENSFDTIADFTDFYSGKLTYSDNPDDLSSPIYYRLAAINACNKPIIRSNIASTIVLTVNNENNLNYLEWSPYKEWNGGVEEYEIYRKTILNTSEHVATVDSNENSFVDDVKNNNLIYKVSDSEFCYYINAVEGHTNPYGITGEGRSEVKCVILSQKIFIPNAFTPNGDGKNDEWKPELSFTPESYHLLIKNRWGNILFESKHFEESWNGKYMNGETVNEGTYIFFLRTKTGTGETIVRKGIINVIFP